MMKIETRPLKRMLLAAGILFLGLCLTTSASALTLSVLPADTLVPPGVTYTFVVDVVVTDATPEGGSVLVGSSDINFNWSGVPGLTATAVSSDTLSSFAFNIDNDAQMVSTASASASGDLLAVGDSLMTITLQVDPMAAGTIWDLFITDADGVGDDDLAAPVPPIPPASIPYVSVGAQVQVVPEPGTLLLLGSGMIALTLFSRRRV